MFTLGIPSYTILPITNKSIFIIPKSINNES